MKGQVVQKGIAIGRVKWIKELEQVGTVKTDHPEFELQAFEDAIKVSESQLQALKSKTAESAGSHEADIFEAHLMMLNDPSLVDPIKGLIQEEAYTALSASEKVYNQTIEMFEALEDTYLQQRAVDIKDIKRRVMGLLSDTQTDSANVAIESSTGIVLVAHEITPSDTLEVDRQILSGMLMMTGGETSHTAILAQSLGIPAMVGCGDSLETLLEGDLVVIDGVHGQIIVNPDDSCLKDYKDKQVQYEEKRRALQAFKGLESVTLSGQSIEIAANIAGPEDIDSVLENDAEGVGLFRTEFIYMNRNAAPSEDEQVEIYSTILKGLKDKTIIFRTMDIGGDKEVSYLNMGEEANPFLGYRAIRYCLREPEIFKTQISAILRAAVHGKAKIMFPMIASEAEFMQAKEMVESVKVDLLSRGIPFADDVPLGIMVEIPSAAILVDTFVEIVDFFSIGTNDLTQYTLAVDRQNSQIADLYDYMHPAVLRLIEMVVTTASKHGKWVGMCGNAASDPKMIKKLVKWGINEISVSPTKVLESRKCIRELS